MAIDEFNLTKLTFKGESPRSIRGKPENPPNQKKNFKTLMDNEEEHSDLGENPSVSLEEKKSSPPSPFDLVAKTKIAPQKKFPVQPTSTVYSPFVKCEGPIEPSMETPIAPWTPEQIAIEEPLPLFEEMTIEPEEVIALDIPQKPRVIEPLISKTKQPVDASAKKPENRKKNDFFPKNPEIISLYEPRQWQPSTAAISSDFNAVAQDAKITRTTINDIVEQMISGLQTIEKAGKTDTIVTLRYPPLFEDATITLTAFENVKREFNVSFANLKDEAKIFLDRKIVEEALVETLARSDITVRLLTTTTLPETNFNAQPQNYYTREEREQQRHRELFENQDEEET